jgi:hypothetical protein
VNAIEIVTAVLVIVTLGALGFIIVMGPHLLTRPQRDLLEGRDPAGEGTWWEGTSVSADHWKEQS